MASKAQFELQGLPSYRTPAIFQASLISVTKMKQCETTVANLEPLRTIDAACLFESAPDAMLLVDGQGRIVVVNTLVEDMFGYRRDDLLGEPVTKLILRRLRNPCLAHRPEHTPAQIASERVTELGLYGVRKDGGEFLIEISFTPFETEEGVLIWNAIRDVSDVRRAQEYQLRLEQASEQLVGANQEIARLTERLEKQNVFPQEEVKLEHDHHEVIGHSEGIRRVLKKAEQVAATDSTVLLLGETGTGKELVARTIHEISRRRQRVMVKVNCAALPASLVESELFGREKGAYTGALTREIGRFEHANGSTILLDEIGELPLELQSKLLRVLQEGEFERLGCAKTIKVDVRVIAATSRNLQLAVREGKFREDLFYRLNVFPMTIPPLRERREDIPALVWHFVNELSQRMGRSIETIHGHTMEAFKNYSWPGNVRELRNVIERFLITNASKVFQADFSAAETAAIGVHPETFEEVERHHILRIMEMVGWRVRGEGGAAQILGLKPTTLESRMQKLDITRPK